MVEFLAILVGMVSLIATWGGMCQVNRMSRSTRHSIRYAIIAETTGYFIQMCAAADYLANANSPAWPWVLLIGVLFTTTSSAILGYISRRKTDNYFNFTHG